MCDACEQSLVEWLRNNSAEIALARLNHDAALELIQESDDDPNKVVQLADYAEGLGQRIQHLEGVRRQAVKAIGASGYDPDQLERMLADGEFKLPELEVAP